LGSRAFVSSLAGLVLTAGYTVWAAGEGLVVSSDWRAVAWAMLVFVGVSVATLIVVQIGFHVALAIRAAASGGGDPERVVASAMVEDEMARLIASKAARASAVGAGAGFVAMLVLLACGAVPGLALHVLLWAGAAGTVVEGALLVLFAERGVGHA
jgi:hypothetical protein